MKDVKKITFQKRPPTRKEIESLQIKPEDDVYGPLLIRVKWKKGKNEK